MAMRPGVILAMLVACGGVAPTAPPTASRPPAHAVRHAGADPTPIDVISGLATSHDAPVAWLDPGIARLELGGAALEANDGAAPIDVGILETQGGQLHVAVHVDDARFAVWTERGRLLGVTKRELRVADYAGGGTGGSVVGDEIEAVIHANAHVHVLAHKDHWAQVLYSGAVEIMGWVPDEAIGDRGPAPRGTIYFPNNAVVTVIPGSVIRAEPKWQGRELAIVASSYFLDRIKDIDDAWAEVQFSDSYVSVHGFVSRHEPPGRLHHARGRDTQPVLAVPNATVPSGTCLYARVGGEPIGYIVGDRAVELIEGIQPGWSSITLDTPWGAVAFAAKGGAKAELEACAPAGAVPLPATATPSVP